MKKINTALLSFGMSGKLFHAPFIAKNEHFHLLGAWERSSKIIQQTYPSAKSYHSLESILSDDDVDLVIINTPTHTHFDYAKKALLAKKDIVVEKAFTTTLQEAIELKNIAESMQKKIAVFQSRRWDSDFLTTKKVIEQTLVGKIIDVKINFERYRPALSNKLHKELPQAGGGLLYDLGPHLIDQALVLFGMPTHVYATLRATRQQSQVDDWFNILLYYSTITVELQFSYFSKKPSAGYIINGAHGTFIKPRGDVQEAQLLAGILPNDVNWGVEKDADMGTMYTDENGKTIISNIQTEQGNYGLFYEGLYDAFLNKKTMPVSCDEAIMVMTIIEKCFESNQLGKKIAVV